MIFFEYLFWISLALLFYCYIGYGAIVFTVNMFRSLLRNTGQITGDASLLPVTIIISAYNEEDLIQQKLDNTLAIDYPSELLKIIFVTEGKMDQAAGFLRANPAVRLLHETERKGKYAAIKRAIRETQTPVVVFSDVNTLLNKDCLRKIIPHYINEKVGGVAGEKKILYQPIRSAVGEGEGLYWRYESFLKKQDAGLYTVVGASGELFSIRTALFKPLDDQLVLDDFVMSMQVCLQGYKIEYEPGAFATELPSASLKEEAKRKIRISAGAYQSIGYLTGCLNFFRRPLLSFQYISRRLFRWIFCPVMLLLLFMSNSSILSFDQHPAFFDWTMAGQLLFYFLAFAGWLMARSGKRTGLLTVPFYFVFMNICLVKGFIRFVRGGQTVLWEKSLRQVTE